MICHFISSDRGFKDTSFTFLIILGKQLNKIMQFIHGRNINTFVKGGAKFIILGFYSECWGWGLPVGTSPAPCVDFFSI